MIKRSLLAARYARAIAYVNLQQYDDAQRDFRKLVAADPANRRFQAAMEWLEDREKPQPAIPANEPRPCNVRLGPRHSKWN